MGSGASSKDKYAASKIQPVEAERLPAISKVPGVQVTLPGTADTRITGGTAHYSGGEGEGDRRTKPSATSPRQEAVHLPSTSPRDHRLPSRDPSNADSRHPSKLSQVESRQPSKASRIRHPSKTSPAPSAVSDREGFNQTLSEPSFRSTPSDKLEIPMRHARTGSKGDMRLGSKTLLDSGREMRLTSKSLPAPRREDERDGSKRSSFAPDLEEIRRLYPTEEFEITMYAILPGLRPGQAMVLQDFREKPSLNGTRGRCLECDAINHVWLIEFVDGKKARVLPPSLQKEVMGFDHQAEQGKPVKGFIAYDTELAEAIYDLSIAKTRQAHIHVVRPDTPPEEILARRRARQQQAQEVADIEEEKTITRKASKTRRKSTHSVHEEDNGMNGFNIGDMVHLLEASGLGVGKIVGAGDKPGLIRVNFGNRGAIYTLKTSEIEKEVPRKKSFVG